MNDEAQAREIRDAGIEVLVVALAMFSLFLGYCYHNNRWFKKIEAFFPHASANIVFGILLGAFIAIITEDRVFRFKSEFFFLYFLPPIVFAAGYEIPKDFFFHNFGTIMLYAFLGTALSSFAIGGLLYAACYYDLGMPNLHFADNMMLGSLVSAIDPVAVMMVLKTLSVDEQLKVILFGESVVNDVAAIVINRVFAGITEDPDAGNSAFILATPTIIGIAIASTLIGTICAFVFAWIFKHSQLRKYPDIEISVFLLSGFVPYAIADVCHLSGIMAILFAGIMADYYTYHHLSKHAKRATKHVVTTLSNISESFVFVYLGMGFFLEDRHDFRTGYCLLTLFLCFIGRAVSVFPLSYCVNLKRKYKIPFKHQLVFWFGGLRGPASFALASATPGHAHDVVLTTTMFIVAVTTIGLGGLAYPYIKLVKPSVMVSTNHSQTYDISNHWFNKLDKRFLKPWFGPVYRQPAPPTNDHHNQSEVELEHGDDVDKHSQEREASLRVNDLQGAMHMAIAGSELKNDHPTTIEMTSAQAVGADEEQPKPFGYHKAGAAQSEDTETE